MKATTYLITIYITIAIIITLTNAAPYDPDSIIDRLHKPWYEPGTDEGYQQNYDKKGQKCWNGICKPVAGGCEDCQYDVPLDFDLD